MPPRMRRRITTAKREEIEKEQKILDSTIVRPFETLEGLPISYNPPPTGNYEDVLKNPLTIKDSAVLYNSLIRSRNTYVQHAPMFKLYWVKQTAYAKKLAEMEKDKEATKERESRRRFAKATANSLESKTRTPVLSTDVNARDVMSKLCESAISLGPHNMEIRIFIAKDARSEKSRAFAEISKVSEYQPPPMQGPYMAPGGAPQGPPGSYPASGPGGPPNGPGGPVTAPSGGPVTAPTQGPAPAPAPGSAPAPAPGSAPSPATGAPSANGTAPVTAPVSLTTPASLAAPLNLAAAPSQTPASTAPVKPAPAKVPAKSPAITPKSAPKSAATATPATATPATATPATATPASATPASAPAPGPSAPAPGPSAPAPGPSAPPALAPPASAAPPGPPSGPSGPSGPPPPPSANLQSVDNLIMISNLNAIAKVDLSLNDLMKVVALGSASEAQITLFKKYIERAKQMGPQPHHADLYYSRNIPLPPNFPRPRPYVERRPVRAKLLNPLKLTAFQEKYLHNATLVFEFLENPNVRYVIPKDSICEVMEAENPPTDAEDDIEFKDILISTIWIHNPEEVEEYEKKLAEYNEEMRKKQEEEEKRKKEIEELEKNGGEGKIPTAVEERNLRMKKRPPPPKKKKGMEMPVEPAIRYTTYSFTLHNIPLRFAAIVMNSLKPIQQVQERMAHILKVGTRVTSFYLWYQVDARLDERVAENLRNAAVQEEKKMQGLITQGSAVDMRKRKPREFKNPKTKKIRDATPSYVPGTLAQPVKQEFTA